MPLPRFENLAEAQRAQILSAAQAEFARHGYEEASLSRIASAAGISKGTLYYYFADRDDVYATVVLRLVQVVGSRDLLGGFAPKRAQDFWPALERLFQAGFELARRHPEEMRALRSFQVSVRKHPRPAFEAVLELMNAHMRLLVETGRALGCVRTDLSVELLVSLLQGVDEVLDRALFEAATLDPKRVAAHAALALDTFRRLLLPHAALGAQSADPRAAALKARTKKNGA